MCDPLALSMHLLDADKCEHLIDLLRSVSDARFQNCASQLQSKMKSESATEAEILQLQRKLNNLVISKKLNSDLSFGVRAMHVHAFYMIEGNTWSLRVDSSNREFSDFVDKVEFLIDYGTRTELVSWSRKSIADATQGIVLSRQFTKKGNGSTLYSTAQVNVTLHFDYANELYLVPSELIPNSETEAPQYSSLVDIFKLICNYIKRHQLSSDDDPSYFTPDRVIHQLLYSQHSGNHPVSFASLLDAMKLHLKKVGPFSFVMQIDPNVTDPTKTERVFEVAVNVQLREQDSFGQEETRNAQLVAMNRVSENIHSINKEIAKLSEPLDNVTSQCVFLESLATNPIKKIQEIIADPRGTTKNVESANKIDYSQMATSDQFYKLPWAVAAAALVIGMNDSKRNDNL